jgi:hypothetical protein
LVDTNSRAIGHLETDHRVLQYIKLFLKWEKKP